MLSEISKEAPLALQAVKALAQYLKCPESDPQKKEAMDQTTAWIDDPSVASNATVLLIAGLIQALEGNLEMALKACHRGLSLEMMALAVQICLRMNRVDLAEKMVEAMSAVDEDAPLSQLATAWVGLQQGGDKLQEAFFVYQELGDKYTWTGRLHNGLAACQMQLGRWEEAEAELLQAFEKNAKDPDTLANLAVVSLHLNKPATRYFTLLKGVAPGHSLLARTAEAQEAIEKAIASFQP